MLANGSRALLSGAGILAGSGDRVVSWVSAVRTAKSLREESMMKAFMSRARAFLVSEDGPTATEYAVMLALIIVVCIAAITTLGQNANTQFGVVRDSLV